jgi:hypothetical protein
MFESAKMTEIAEPFEMDLQRFAEGEGTPAGDSGGAPAPNTTSSIIPGDNYASGGPEPPENEPAERVDFENFDFNHEPEGDEGEPAGEETPPETPPEVPPEVKKEQSPEANAAFAELRRKAEQAERELQARDQWVEDNFGATHNLHSWQQYQQAIEASNQQQAAQRQQEIQDRPRQVAQATYQQLIQQGYDDAVAREIANAKGAAEAANLRFESLQNELNGFKNQTQQEKLTAQQQAEQQAAQARAKEIVDSWETDRQKLAGEYGDLVPKDLKSLDPAIVEKLQKGYSFADAWIASNHKNILEQKEKAAAQKTLNNLDSKKHLKTEGDGGADSNASSFPLSGDTLAMYMDSGMTEKQARAFHKKLYG